MKAAEIRQKFLKYFEKNGHTIVESSSLVPQNDPSLLFTNAGMVQFKDVFLGKENRPYRRATTTQKCVRAGGKHNDLENVGFTARHHTFFEMLGNFSFGDYFKKDAIRFAWEFVTKELGLPKDRLYVTVFKEDAEAAEIWEKQEGVPKDRIYRMGEKDNFWAMGDTGPCGPCSEIYIDRGAKYSCGKSTCQVGCDCDRFMEFWNLVFMQFERDSSGKLTPLPKPSVDTGAGLERIASILQNVDTNYETDLFQSIISKTATLAKKTYVKSAPDAVSYRVVADHARATTFLIGDGVMPSNEGRGYVLRRIMRRAIRHGGKLGFKEAFFFKVCGFVIEEMKAAFPDLVGKKAFIEKAVQAEEEQFLRTLERGLKLLDEEVMKLSGKKTLPGDIAFTLYDTYGFPLDLTRVICEEKGLSVDEAGFEKSMERQRSESRKHWKGSGEEAVDAIYLKLAEDLASKKQTPVFTGYEAFSERANCVALLVAGGKGLQAATSAQAGKEESIQAVFAKTPFYGESGGQSGDRGRVTGEGFEAEVIDVQKPVGDLIVAHLKILKGAIAVGKQYLQETDRELRALTARNHTATHLLHWALREVLGSHVKQAGSLVNPDLLRFDFSHFQPMTAEELKKTEDLINSKIWRAEIVKKQVMPKDQAVAAGAIAFFGEKYGSEVRVISVGDFSVELCGGTHIDNSAEINLFKIGNENGIAAGVRRIIAYTSKGAFQYLRSQDDELKKVREQLKASSTEEIFQKLEKLTQNERDLRKQIEKLQSKAAGEEFETLLKGADKIGNALILTAVCEPNVQGIKYLRELCDRIKVKAPEHVLAIGVEEPETKKAAILISVGASLTKKVSAGELLKDALPLIDGKGGGKPDLAQAGGSKPEALPQAMNAVKKRIQSLMK
jgi:alanyl-tRNA synthetase